MNAWERTVKEESVRRTCRTGEEDDATEWNMVEAGWSPSRTKTKLRLRSARRLRCIPQPFQLLEAGGVPLPATSPNSSPNPSSCCYVGSRYIPSIYKQSPASDKTRHLRTSVSPMPESCKTRKPEPESRRHLFPRLRTPHLRIRAYMARYSRRDKQK